MADIFISYSRLDIDRIKPIAEALEKRGWTVWWDPNITTDKPFDRFIKKELKIAKSVLVIWSKNSIGSNRVKSEAAEGLGKQILVPVIIDPDIDVPIQFRILQSLMFINVKNIELSEEFKKLLTSLKEIIGPLLSGKPSALGGAKNILKYYALICFALDDLDELVKKFDDDALNFLIKSFGEHLNRFFYPRGGYCLRETINEYSVFFPNKDFDSVRIPLENFAASLRETGMPKTTLRPFVNESISADAIIVKVLAGLALGKPLIEKELVLELARFNQEILATFSF